MLGSSDGMHEIAEADVTCLLLMQVRRQKENIYSSFYFDILRIPQTPL